MAPHFCNRRFASRSSRDGAALCVRAGKSPARSPARAAGVISVNTLFWKILVTRVKRVVGGLVSYACRGAPKLEFTSAFQGAADMARRLAPATFVAIDPKRASLIRSRDLNVVPETDPMIDLLHRCARRLVRPGGALAACRVRRDVVKLDSVRAFQIARRLRRQPQQIHPHRFPREIAVAIHFEGSIAVRDHLTAPYRRHQ